MFAGPNDIVYFPAALNSFDAMFYGLLTDLSATFTVPDTSGGRLATVTEPFSDSESTIELPKSFAQRVSAVTPLVGILIDFKLVKLYILY